MVRILYFTYLENEKLNRLSAKQRKKAIANITDELAGEINKIIAKDALISPLSRLCYLAKDN